MGCYIYHAGTVNISKDKAAEFERNILHIFGMMQVEVAELFEKRLFLIHPVEPDESSGNYRASFNYFEDNMHEEAGYSPSSHYVYSNKIGSFAFNHVILLCQLMQELYGGGNCLIYGDIDDSLVKYTSWINRTFGTTFDLAYRTDLLHVYRVLQEEKWMDPKNIDCIEDFLVDCKISSIGALMDAYIETHSVLETLRFFKSRYSRNPWIKNVGRWMYQLTHAFVQKRRTSSQSVDEQIREALSYRNWQEQHPYAEPPSNLKPFIYSVILPVNTVFHLIAYAYPTLSYEEARTRYGAYLTRCPPFLSRKASDPDTWEAIQKAKCSLKDIVLCDNDDDRIYWWRKDGDFDLSKGCRTWLDDLRSEHRAICKEMAASSISYHEHLKTLFDTLFYINDTYENLFMFRSSFYDILKMPTTECSAAVELLKRLAHRNESAFRAHRVTPSSFRNTNKPSESRSEIKRFLGVLGNPSLRKSVFAF